MAKKVSAFCTLPDSFVQNLIEICRGLGVETNEPLTLVKKNEVNGLEESADDYYLNQNEVDL